MKWAQRANHETVRGDLTLSAALRAFDEAMDIVGEVFGPLALEKLQQLLADGPTQLPSTLTVLYFGISD